MASNEYHFITQWRMEAKIEEIAEILSNAPDLARWWKSVYLEVQELEKGDEKGIGRYVSLYTKGWLPYTLRWNFRVTESNPPHGFTIVAEGDFVGRGIWTLQQDGAWATITYDWKISATKPLLRTLSPLMKPLFSMNHEWAMQQGETSLKLELLRRHNPNQQSLIPAPPAGTPSQPLVWFWHVLTKK